MTDEDRDKLIGQMLDEGQGLSEIQKHLESEHSYKITYMDLRLLAADLEVNWKKIDDIKNPPVVEDDDAETESLDAELLPDETVVEVSPFVRPGAMFSGDVTFKSGIKAEWYVDSMGRLGLNPRNEEDQPSEEEIADFQMKLQKELEGKM